MSGLFWNTLTEDMRRVLARHYGLSDGELDFIDQTSEV
jgi:hypothetical protein